jgi:aryl-alcohol dehydrogenase
VDGGAGDLAQQLRAITNGFGVDGAIDTTGVPATIPRALPALAMPGTYVLVGSVRPGVASSFDMTTLQNGRAIRGCIQGDSRPAEFIPRLVSLFRTGRFPVDRLVTFYDLADINRAAADLESGRAIKPVIRMPAPG